MIVGTVTMPSGTQIDPQRPISKQINIDDIAENLAHMPVYCGPLTLEISVGQSALNAVAIYERIARDPGIHSIHYLLLRNAWQYVLKNVRIPVVHILERGCIDQLRDIQEAVQNKILAKFQTPYEMSTLQQDELRLAVQAEHYFNLIRFGKYPLEALPRTAHHAISWLEDIDMLSTPHLVLSPAIVKDRYLQIFHDWAPKAPQSNEIPLPCIIGA